MPDSGNVNISGNTGNWNANIGSGRQEVHGGMDSRAVTLGQVDQLVSRLLAGVTALPPGNAAILAGEAVTIRNEAHEARPDEGRIRHALSRITEAAAPVAGMIELSRQLADLIAQLVH